MKIFIDNDFKCHISNDGTMREFDVDFFDGKCDEFIDGYRYVPHGETWTRDDGQSFAGEILTPWKELSQLALAQSAADRVQAEADEQISTLLDTIEELIIGG